MHFDSARDKGGYPMAKIKIVLVDDELTARNTIKKYLEDSSTYEVEADFANGKAVLEWLRKNKTDILLCDMQMPEINGVELMRSVHIIDGYLPVIAISGYDDFNYVRGSLINGAANYLLKHELTKESLLKVLDQVRDKYRIVPEGKETYRKKGYCIYEESDFTPEKIQSFMDEGKVDFSSQNIVPVAISPDFKLHKGVNPSEYKQDICKAILDMLGQILDDKYPYFIYMTKKNHIILLLSFKGERSMLYMINSQSNLVDRLQRQIIRMLDTTVTVINGEIHGNLKNAVSEALKMEKLLEDKLYLGGNRILSFAVAKGITYYNGELPGKLWEQLSFELANHMDRCLDTIYDMLGYMEQKRFAWERVFQSCGTILNLLQQEGLLEEKERQDTLSIMREFEEYEQFRSEILEQLHKSIQSFRSERKQQYSALVGQIIEYIEQNIASDISLEKCAELVGSSYTYLSREFKKETGMRFVEFLNHQRVNQAKSLLIRGDMSMKEIVEMSGFRNYNYFFKVFKEIEGMTPSEFTAKNQSNS